VKRTEEHVAERPKRIAFIDHTTKMGGGQVYLLRQLGRLDRQRYHPVVVCPSEGALTKFVKQAGFELHILPMHSGLIELKKDDLLGDPISMVLNPFRFVAAIIRLIRWFRRNRIELVHLNSMKSGFYGGIAARLSGIPVVWDFKDILSRAFFPSLTRRLVVAIGNNFVDTIVANSQAIADAYLAQGGSPAKVRVITNGIDLEVFNPSNSGEDIKAELGLGPEITVVSIFSRLDRWKGHTYFLQAAARVAAEFDSARFLVVGALTFDDAAYGDELEQLTNDLNLVEKVAFLGFRQDISSLMAASDVIVHASTLPEPLGLTPMESQAAGKPVVAVGAGGVLETVLDGDTGLLIPPKDAVAMSEALLQLLRTPSVRTEMGRLGRSRAEELFDLDINALRVQDVYAELIKNP
jgi:glycosyltransferase involved in cell wall biosynthesis